jgi:hypothetical protein
LSHSHSFQLISGWLSWLHAFFFRTSFFFFSLSAFWSTQLPPFFYCTEFIFGAFCRFIIRGPISIAVLSVSGSSSLETLFLLVELIHVHASHRKPKPVSSVSSWCLDVSDARTACSAKLWHWPGCPVSFQQGT